MSLSPPTSPRVLKHTRTITVEAYTRDDGLWDLDAHITDIKTRDVELKAGIRLAGEPWHDLWLRITIDTRMQIVAAQAVSDRVPYPGFCQAVTPDYQRMVGLSLVQGFRFQLMQRLGGVSGCTHLTELAQVLPTAAIQALAGEVSNLRMEGEKDTARPFQIDRCYSMRADGPAVAQYYPRWAVPPTGPGPR